MREETLYELETPYRQKFKIRGFRFEEGEKACAMVAAVLRYGQKMGVILDPFTAEVEAEITCPTSGVVFFALKKPLTTEHEVAFKVIRRLHGGCL